MSARPSKTRPGFSNRQPAPSLSLVREMPGTVGDCSRSRRAPVTVGDWSDRRYPTRRLWLSDWRYATGGLWLVGTWGQPASRPPIDRKQRKKNADRHHHYEPHLANSTREPVDRNYV